MLDCCSCSADEANNNSNIQSKAAEGDMEGDDVAGDYSDDT